MRWRAPVLAAALAAGLGVLLASRTPESSFEGERLEVDEDAEAPALSPLDAPVSPTPASATLRGPTTAPQASPLRGDVLVSVRARGGVPLPVVPLRLVRRGAPTPDDAVATGLDGTVLLRDVPLDGSATLSMRDGSGPVWPLGAGVASADVRLSDVVLLEADVVDALTGRSVIDRLDDAGGILGAVTADPLLWRRAIRVKDGSATAIGLSLTTPRGLVAWDATSWSAVVSPLADLLTATYPLRREAQVVLEVQDDAGTPTRAPWSAKGDVAGRPFEFLRESAGSEHRLRGIAWFPGQSIGLTVSTAETDARSASASAYLSEDPTETLRLSVRLPPAELSARSGADFLIGFGGGAGGAFSGRRRTDPARLGSVKVRVKRSDGTPARGAPVSIGSLHAVADDEGIARFANVPSGRCVALLEVPGLVRTWIEVDVRARAETEADLVESRGGRVDVVVVDEKGRPAPYATLSVALPSGMAFADLDGTTQRVDMFTDHLGRRSFLHVEPGAVRVSATYGEWRGETEVTLPDGGRSEVRIEVLAPPVIRVKSHGIAGQ